ncbi:hypothetical protein H6501_04275 [Candidatus Woesearchaeota archaeon]|nr:hypothetical protein [Nanoarchaeota archaeon]MCB9370789.1 hypothetical protein [Candidatus Woesearchaeota archaeon]USN43890.1 MAG: hypothetical protein H6500_05875 [Candidatus Woesearchaeota archaeon]
MSHHNSYVHDGGSTFGALSAIWGPLLAVLLAGYSCSEKKVQPPQLGAPQHLRVVREGPSQNLQSLLEVPFLESLPSRVALRAVYGDVQQPLCQLYCRSCTYNVFPQETLLGQDYLPARTGK